MDRVFKKSHIDDVCDDIKLIITQTKTEIRRMKNVVKKAQKASDTVPAEVPAEGLNNAINNLDAELEALEFEVLKTKLKKCKSRTEQIISEDESSADEVDALVKQVSSAKGVLGEMKGFMKNVPLTTKYDDFMDMMDIAANRWNGKLRNIKREVDKIRKNTKGAEKRSTEFSKDPVNLSTGNFIYDRTDLVIGGEHPFVFRRFYNAINDRCGVLGRDWNHNYEVTLETDGNEKVLILEEGKEERFLQTSTGNYVSLYHSNGSLEALGTGFCYRTRAAEEYRFDSRGLLVEIYTRNGISTIFHYEQTVLSEDQRLVKVERATGEFFAFTYSEDGRYLRQVADHTGRCVTYEIKDDLLRSVCTPKGHQYCYRYHAGGKLISVTNPCDIAIVENTYDEQLRIIHQKFPDGGSMSYEYDDEQNAVILTERNGSKVTYIHDEQFRDIKHIYSDGEECFTYNKMNQKTLVVDKLGNKTQYGYDERGNITRIINALGHKTELRYQEFNQPVYLAINGQQKLRNRYNEQGDLIETIDALGNRYGIRYRRPGQAEAIQQPDGSEIQLTYDGRGNIIKLIDAAGNITRYHYDALNRVRETIDGNGNRTSYEYDQEDNITKVINAAGAERIYTYNKSNKVTEIKDFDDSCIRREYNVLNRPSKVIDQEGRETLLTYDAMWNLARITEPNGAKTTFVYNEHNHLGRVRKANGEVVRYLYDAKGNLIREMDEEGAATHFTYDAADQLIRVIDPEGNETSYEYDPEGNLITVRDSLGNEAAFTYDAGGNLIQEQGPCGERRSYTYTPLGSVASITDENGRETVYLYEAGDMLKEIHYSDGTAESYTYDGNGNISTYTDVRGYTLCYTYDSLNQVVKITGSESEEKQYSYDSVGNVTSMTDSMGNTTRYAYTLTGQLKQVIDALGYETEYRYDVCDRLIEIRQYGDAESTSKAETKEGRIIGGIDGDLKAVQEKNSAVRICQVTRYERDMSGKIVGVMDALGQKETYRYGKRGELLEKVDKEGYLTRYGYTAHGEVNRIQYADGREVRLSYNPLKHLQEIEDWLGVTRIATDPLGRATRVQYPNGKEVSYRYGVGGERRSITYPDGKTVSYGYDAQLRLKELREGNQVIAYNYNESGDLAEKLFSNGVKTVYSYSKKGQLTSLVHQDLEGVLDAYYYRYDALGNKQETAKHRRGLAEETGIYRYGYDPIGRLQRVEKDGRLLSSYQYDAFGNRLMKKQGGIQQKITTYTYNAINQLIKIVDPDTEIVYNYDKRGNISGVQKNNEQECRYVYGALNRLEEARNKHGQIARYQYNGLGHRVGKEIYRSPDTGMGLVGMRTEVGLDPLRLVQEQIKLPMEKIAYTIDLTQHYYNLLQKSEAGSQQTFLWDGNAASVYTEKSNTETQRDFYLQDDLGSPIRLIGETGSQREYYGYDEFGEELYCNSRGIQPLGYTGYQCDPVAGTLYAQAREYRPETGRFDGRDVVKGSIRYPFTMNEYGYCWNQPLNMVDLDGKIPKWLYGSQGKSKAYADGYYGDVSGPSFNFDEDDDTKKPKRRIGLTLVDFEAGIGKVGYEDNEGIWQGKYEMKCGHANASAGINDEYAGARVQATAATTEGKVRILEVGGKKIYLGANLDILSVGARLGYSSKDKKIEAGVALGVGVGFSLSWEDIDEVKDVEKD